jgi:hypothetical protein
MFRSNKKVTPIKKRKLRKVWLSKTSKLYSIINKKHNKVMKNTMSRSELVATAAKLGIKNASKTKSVDLEKLIEKSKSKMSDKPKTGKRGRPVVEGSARQLREAARAARIAANGGVVKRGRPAKAKVEAEA